jgi:phosphoribosylformylglycinamidine (FGAM) synthase PurS component
LGGLVLLAKGAAEMRAKVYVSYKDGVLDPQGQAVRNAIAKMGYSGFTSVRQGKFFEIDKLLHNVNIEKYRFEIEE